MVYIIFSCRFFGKLSNLLTQLHYPWISLTFHYQIHIIVTKCHYKS